MSDFMYLFAGGNPVDQNVSPAAAQEQGMRWAKWTEKLRSQGRYIGGDTF